MNAIDISGVKPEKLKRIMILNFEYEDSLWLCHSKPGTPPDGDAGGYFRPNSSFVWVKVNKEGTWEQTPWRSVHKAMDFVLRCKSATEAVSQLIRGESHVEESERLKE